MLNLYINFLVFLLGLIIGSFLNCVIYRLNTEESFLRGRSFCPRCGNILSWQDLIPVLSFLILRGKCRYCHQKISWQYPLVELATGLIFLLIFNFQFTNSNEFPIYNLQNFLTTIYLLLTTSFLIIIFVYDLKHYIIPDKVIYPAIGISFVFNFLNSYILNHESFFNPLGAGLGTALFFLSIVLISKGKWMGLGDAKLSFLMGLFLSFPNIFIALYLAFLTGAIVGVILIFLGKKNLKSEIPFAPFLIGGTFFSLFLSKQVINIYFGFFLLK